MSTTTSPAVSPASLEPQTYVRMRTRYPAGSQAQVQQQLAATATGVPYDGVAEEAVVRLTSIEQREGYWYATWLNEQPPAGALRRHYTVPGGRQWLLGSDPRLGSFGAVRLYDEPREYGTTVVAVVGAEA